MAIFEDKKKPVNIYAPGTPTVKAQDKMSKAVGGAVKPIVDSAQKFSGNILGGNATAAMLTGAVNANEKNRQYLATQANKSAREKLGLQFPKGRMVAQNVPSSPIAPQPPTVQRDGIQSKRLDAGTQASFKNAMSSVAQTPTNPVLVSPARESLLNKYPVNGSVERGPQRVGNMDVTFDKSTSQGARKAFLEAGSGRNPQESGISSELLAQSDRAHQEQYMRRISGGGMVPLYQSVQPAPASSSVTQGESLDFSSMTPEQRRFAVAREKIAGVRGSLRNEEERNRIAAQGNEQTFQLGQRRNSIDERGQDLTTGIAAERNRIDAAGVAVQDRASQSQIEARDLEIQDKLRKSGYEKEYFDKNTTPERRIQLETMLGIKRKAEYDTLKQYEDGVQTGESLYNKETGEIKQGGSDPAMDIVNGNPAYKERFNAASPEEKKVMLQKIRERMAAG